MAESNFQRMIAIINETFATRNDPDQLQVTEQDREKLEQLHEDTLSEYSEGNGPCVWVLIFPTTKKLMHEFIEGKLSETELLHRTDPKDKLECIYLCSATTLPEYRNKGITSRVTLDAIRSIGRSYPVNTLFVWPFTPEGRKLAEKISEQAGLPLQVRAH